MHWLLIAVISVASVNVPWADWQNTNWTMSRAEVIRATGATAVEGTPGQRSTHGDLGAEGEYEALGIGFVTRFYFDRADRLSGVRLVPKDMAVCDDLAVTLAGIYGDAVEQSRLPSAVSAVWIDGESGDNVRYTNVTRFGECFIFYSPGSRSGASGL